MAVARLKVVRRGFTLIEILCVVVILGIISAVVIPSIGTNDDLKASTAARSVVADLVYAQSRAITVQARQYMVFDVAGNRYRLASAVDPVVVLTHPTRHEPYVVQFGGSTAWSHKDQRVVSADFDTQTILGFDPLGTPLAVEADGTTAPMIAGKIVVGAGAHRMTIKIEPYTGEISVVPGE